MTRKRLDKLVVIASSTGGPKSLHKLIPYLHANLDAPVVVIQHMPRGFTPSLASRLNDSSEIPVSEVKEGDILKKGHVYIAQGGMHLKFEQNQRGEIVCHIQDSPAVNCLKPCADYTIEDLLDFKIDFIVFAVLTGMGSDGCDGIAKMKQRHNIYTIAQNKETCVIYGMPKAIADSNLADKILPLELIGNEINKKVGVF